MRFVLARTPSLAAGLFLATSSLVAVFGFGAPGPASAAAAPVVTKIECGLPVHAGQFDAVWLVNQGDAPLDLAGWHLRSDPEDSQQMDLATLGGLAPGEQKIVTAGGHAVAVPSEKIYVWTYNEMLRDSGDPPDYVKLYDASGSFVSGMNCNGQVLTTAAPAPTPAPVAAANPAPAPASQPKARAATAPKAAAGAKAVPNAGGAPGDTSPESMIALGVLAVLGGVMLVALAARRDLITARITSIEGETRDRRGEADNRGRDRR